MPEISVIVTCYNEGKYVGECLDSLVGQTFKDFEVIAVNDGSSDNSPKIIKTYAGKYNNIKFIDQPNRGIVAARNNGIAASSGKYIFPLDGDDKISPDCLAKLDRAMKDGKGDIITFRVYRFGTENTEMFLRQPTLFNMSAGNCLVNAALFRKSDFEAAGGYDEAFHEGLEDYDLWLNMMIRHNLKIYRVPEILFFYRIKNAEESRNKRHRKDRRMTAMLKQRLLDKYPKLRFLRTVNSILHFFWNRKCKKGEVYIKIFGITVRKIGKKDAIN